MDSETFDFTTSMENIDRQALLQEAAQLLDAGRSHLGGDKAIVRTTPEGDLVRGLLNDEARMAAYPDVYKITDEAFLSRQLPVPVKFQELAKDYNFYWIRFPIGLSPARGWGFNQLVVRIEFGETGNPHSRAKAYQILPDKKFETQLKISDHLEIGINENFEFAARVDPVQVDTGGVAGKAGAGVDVKGAAGLGFVAGPFQYTLKKSKIDHNSTGMEWVRWQLDGAEFFQEDSPDLVVIAQAPRDATKLKVSAAMQASRYFSFATADLQQAVKQFPKALQAFFQGGLPTTPDRKEYDLTPRL